MGFRIFLIDYILQKLTTGLNIVKKTNGNFLILFFWHENFDKLQKLASCVCECVISSFSSLYATPERLVILYGWHAIFL